MKRAVLALSFLILASMAAVTPVYAVTSVGPTTNDLWTYTFTLPTIVKNADGGASETGPTAQWSVSFLGGPFGSSNAAIDTYGPTGSPLPDGWWSGATLTSGTTDINLPVADWDLTSLTLMYSDGSGTDLAFVFLEPNSFWATPGTYSSFDNGAPNSAYGLLYTDPATYPNYQEVWGYTNVGASYAAWTNTGTNPDGSNIYTQSDPPCASCSVIITDTPEVVTPEPSSFLLLGSGLVGFAGMVRRKVKARLS